MLPDCQITLTVKETPTAEGGGFLYHVDVDGTPIANNQALTAAQAEEVTTVARAYGAMFEQPVCPQVDEEVLNGLGERLFDVWLAQHWAEVEKRLTPGCRRWLVIASEVAALLNLPWELLRPAGDDAIGADNKWTVRRLPCSNRRLGPRPASLRAGPLRILFLASAPTDEVLLDYEREERHLLDAMEGISSGVVYDSCDLGTYDELEERIDEFEPHIVHLCGHGIVNDGQGWFVFENEEGKSDVRSARGVGDLFAGSGVQCAFVSGCQTGKAPEQAALAGVCQGLVSEGVPLAIGWAASIVDDVANQLARTFYDRIAKGQPVDGALARARHKAREFCAERRDPSWSLPVLYAATAQAELLDRRLPPEPPARRSLTLHALPGMTEGHAEHFIGRRRELQLLLPALRTGKLQGMVLTGLGGAGKSTLATRLARKLQADGLTPIAVSAQARNPSDPTTNRAPLSPAMLIERVADALLAAGRENDEKILRAPNREPLVKLRHLVLALNEGNFVLVLDNLETSMDEATRQIRDDNLRAFYQHLMGHLSGGSRVIVTSRFLPAESDPLPNLWRELPLADFPAGGFLKYMLRDEVVARRYYAGELPHLLMRRLHRLLGGTPRFMEQIRTVLQTIEKNALGAELDAVERGLPSEGAGESQLQAKRDAYCETIFTGRLYGALAEEQRRWLSRAAVFSVPGPVEGLAAASRAEVGEVRRAIQTWQRSALVYPDIERGKGDLWAVYGTLRGWAMAPDRLPADERRAAEEAAGDYLVKVREDGRATELGLSSYEMESEARDLFLAADAISKAREATGRISRGLMLHGQPRETIRICQELLEREEHTDPLLWGGMALLQIGDLTTAREWFSRAESAANDDPHGRAAALANLGQLYIQQGNYLLAKDNLEKSRSVLHRLVDSQEKSAALAGVLGILGRIDLKRGDRRAAREKYAEALQISQETNNREIEANAWHQLGTIEFDDGNYGIAREKFLKAHAISKHMGDLSGEVHSLQQLARIDMEVGDIESARKKFESTLGLIENPTVEATVWHEIGTIALNERNYKEAQTKFAKSLKIRQRIFDREGEAVTWYQLAIVAWDQDRHPEGFKLAVLSALILRSIDHYHADKASRSVSGMAQELGYSEQQIQSLINEVGACYRADRGQLLYRQAFGEGLDD